MEKINAIISGIGGYVPDYVLIAVLTMFITQFAQLVDTIVVKLLS